MVDHLEQLEQRHKGVPTRVAITDTLTEIHDALAQSTMLYDPYSVTPAAANELTGRLCGLNLYLGALFARLHEECGAARKPYGFAQGERFFWMFELPSGKWRAMLTVQGVERVLGERDTHEQAYELCEQRARLRVVGGGK